MVSVEQANAMHRAKRTSQSGSDVKLNLRPAERHMPGMFNGKATEHTEYMFKMEAYLSTDKDMDDDEVTNLAAIYWNVSALNSALATCLITTTTGEGGTLLVECCKPGSGLRAWLEFADGTDQNQLLREQLPWPASSRHRERSRLVNHGDPSWTGNSVWQNTRVRRKFCQGRSTEVDDDSRDERFIEGPNHVP